MQDKTEFDQIGKKFVDKSWKSLNARLDSELPVFRSEPKHKTSILYSVILLCFISLAYLSYIYTTRIPIVPATKYVVRTQVQYVPYQEVLKNQTHNTQVVSSQGIIDIDNNGILPSTISNPISTNIIAENKIGSRMVSELNIQKIPEIKLLEESPASLDLLTTYSFAGPEIEEDIQLRKRKHNLGFSFSLSTFISNQNYTGYGLGLGFEIPLRGALLFETGIHMNFLSKDYFILPFLERDNPNNFKSLVSPNLQDADTYYSGLVGFKQFVMPAGLAFSFENNLTMNGGIRFRYTYSESIEQELETKARKKIAGNQSVAETFFNNSNLGVYSGLSYRFTDHFSMRLDAEFGLSSLVSNQAISDPYFKKFDLNLINLSSSFKF